MTRAYYVFAYFLSWFLFGLFGLLLNLGCIPLLLLPARFRGARWIRAVIRALFRLWVCWIHASKVVRVTWKGFDGSLPEGVLYVANHPTLVDATFLMAKLTNASCIFKPALMRNPAIGPAAIMAAYISGGDMIEIIRSASDAVAACQSFLIFPEGTRTTSGSILEPLRPGFALVAKRAKAPVQLILIRSSNELVPRGRPWWRPPELLPARMEITLDRRWDHDPGTTPQELAAAVEARMREALAPQQPPVG